MAELLQKEDQDSKFYHFATSTHRNRYLPNYFLDGNGEARSDEYSTSHVVFLHNLKSGGTTMKGILSHIADVENLSQILIRPPPATRKQCTQLSRDKSISKDRLIIDGSGTFGICDVLQVRACSYFTVIRNPIERLISKFFFCQQNRSNCRTEFTQNGTIVEAAKEEGSPFFQQLLAHSSSCETPFENIDQYIDQFRKAGKWVNGPDDKEVTIQRLAILNYFLDNLVNWFAVIGITEEYDATVKALEAVYKLPFTKYYKQPKNSGTIRSEIEESEMAALRSELENSPVVQEALYEDMKLYAKAKEIFERQKNSLLRSK